MIVIALLLVACRRPEQAAAPQNQTSPATPTTTAPPQDLSKAKINTVVPVNPPTYVRESRLGSKLDAEKNVAEEKVTFKRNEPVYLTMWLQQSPKGLQTSVRWYDSNGNQIDEEFRPMNGEKVVTFKFDVKRPKAGAYRAVGYWGGNIAAEYDFTVTQ